MPLRKIDVRYVKRPDGRIHQGDIFRDVTLTSATGTDDDLIVESRLLPYLVVLTQDCDLEQDFKARANQQAADQDKHLPMVLICPAYLSASFREGKHIDGQVMQRHNTKEWVRLKSNQSARYHFLQPDLPLQVPELVLDFKHYFTVPRLDLYTSETAKQCVATLNAVFREVVCRRFGEYLTRIAVPELADNIEAAALES